MKVGFAGLSHLGLVSSICVAAKNFATVCYDGDQNLIQNLKQNKLPVFEPELDSLLEKHKKSIHFTHALNDLQSCDVVYVSLDVKTDDSGISDLSALRGLIEDVKGHIKPQGTLVILSQVPPGFMRTLSVPSHVSLYYQVETLIFGRAVERSLHPERYMIGCLDPTKPLPGPYETLLKKFDCPLLPMRFESAELCKISINMFLAASVTTTNTLAEICENTGAHWSEIAPALKLDKRIGPYAYLGPGLGLAGGNIERDIATIKNLSMRHGTEGSLAECFIQNSRYRKDWALRQTHRFILSKSNPAPIAVWGIAYKQDTKSTKNSPSLELAKGLPGVRLKMYDPQATLPDEYKSEQRQQTSSALEACKDAQGLVIMTPWAEFSKIDLDQIKSSLKTHIIIDPFEMLNRGECLRRGFEYMSLGKQAGVN